MGSWGGRVSDVTPDSSLDGVWVGQARPVLPDVQRIAVLRANGIGDLIFALPALAAFRAAYRRAELILLADSWHGPFLEGRGVVDRVITVPAFGGVREGPEDGAEQGAFFARMQDERIDVGVQMHGGGRNSNPFVRRLGARLTLGLRTPDAEPLDLWAPYFYLQPEVLRYLEVAALAGAPAVSVEPRLPPVQRDNDEADALGLPDHGPLVAINAGASDARRRWAPERFAAVADRLAEAGATVLLTGGPQDMQLVQSVQSYMQAPAVALAGRLSLSGLAGVLRRCSVVVSNDSGPLHLAAAVGAATVGVYWCANLLNASAFSRARHRLLVSWRVECGVCGARFMDTAYPKLCRHEASVVDLVNVDEVSEQALDLLLRPPDPADNRE